MLPSLPGQRTQVTVSTAELTPFRIGQAIEHDVGDTTLRQKHDRDVGPIGLRCATDDDCGMPAIRVIACDIFGTTVDWYTGVTSQIEETLQGLGIEVDPGQLAADWRGQYGPSMQRVRDGARGWANLDILHRESLDELLRQRGIADAVDESARRRLVRAWHHLPAWDDTTPGLARLRTRYVIAALSNGGFALLTNLVKAAGLPFDCVVSAELIRAYKPDLRVYRC